MRKTTRRAKPIRPKSVVSKDKTKKKDFSAVLNKTQKSAHTTGSVVNSNDKHVGVSEPHGVITNIIEEAPLSDNKMEMDFQTVEHKRRLSRDNEEPSKRINMRDVNPPRLIIKNRFDTLNNVEDAIEETEESTDNDATTKPVRPPPFVIHGKFEDNRKMISSLKQVATKGFHVKYTKNNVNIYIADVNQWRSYNNYLIDNNIEHHTYTLKGEKTHAFVLRGLEGDVTEEEVEVALKNYLQTQIVKVYKMKNTRSPLFLVTTKNTCTLKQMNAEIRTVLYTKIRWERRINMKKMIQCHRCQMWGHATSNCYSTTKCAKCAGNHWTSECNETPDNAPKCINCNGDHYAYDIKCPTYEEKIEQINAKKQPVMPKQQTNKQFNVQNKAEFPNIRYRPAPVPHTNPWKTQPSGIERTSEAAHGSQQVNSKRLMTPIDPPHGNTNPFASNKDTVTQFSELKDEINKLNSLVDISKMIQAIRELNQQLVNCQNSSAKAIAFINFIQNCETYGI